jgi:hypothetical protein
MSWFEDKSSEIYRFERKFLITELSLKEIETIIKLNPAIFREAFHIRQINNVYFDSFELGNYYDNVDGQSRRTKQRIRWYGETFTKVEKPILEFKIKSGFLGLKESFVLPAFDINSSENDLDLGKLTEKAELPENIRVRLKDLRPTLLNRYKRKYFLSHDGSLRVTIDWDLEFFRINNNGQQMSQSVKLSHYIVELKYGYADEEKALKVSNAFPFRLTKSSKYVDGIDNLASRFIFNK